MLITEVDTHVLTGMEIGTLPSGGLRQWRVAVR
jgi:hypothetical protein